MNKHNSGAMPLDETQGECFTDGLIKKAHIFQDKLRQLVHRNNEI